MAALRIPVRLLARNSAQHSNVLRNRAAFLTVSQHVRLHSSESLPRIAQASTWKAIMPKFLRDPETLGHQKKKPIESREWNPATFFIVIFILIGSQAIRLLLLKKDYEAYTRSADAKIKLLKEVIEKINNGEKVDVERLLGTGDAHKEREWDEVLREIEAEDSLWHQKRSEKDAQAPAQTEPVVQEQPAEQRAKGGIRSLFFRTKSSENGQENNVEEADDKKDKNQPRKPVFF
ncbi:hypothetical protein DTO166G4_3487 [Paecilomyces variotii]|nr:hypothetical protein DTO164E3_205 [Paecilomyces variotii]KAJ9214895.1 hypothetical protein DTO166G4_3487 [Paecilomyces variotii]KAJ9227384.1 hypothetical protein DTO169C6_25 [Paecilomyces variotii]KAJ9238424.1 hypothetical protein DTO166G5_2972 [Paecilomyces variotii]KAJ9246114.1 hypothetical protein DTO169E5_238 [Paecilomyces variotii]